MAQPTRPSLGSSPGLEAASLSIPGRLSAPPSSLRKPLSERLPLDPLVVGAGPILVVLGAQSSHRESGEAPGGSGLGPNAGGGQAVGDGVRAAEGQAWEVTAARRASSCVDRGRVVAGASEGRWKLVLVSSSEAPQGQAGRTAERGLRGWDPARTRVGAPECRRPQLLRPGRAREPGGPALGIFPRGRWRLHAPHQAARDTVLSGPLIHKENPDSLWGRDCKSCLVQGLSHLSERRNQVWGACYKLCFLRVCLSGSLRASNGVPSS